jgi:hypothetical protein
MSAPAAAPNGAGDARDPSGFLAEIIGAPVTVKLNSGVVYKGRVLRMRSENVKTDGHCRRITVCGWLYEHCAGTDEGICGGQA